MNMRDKKNGGGVLTLAEAVETLSSIADFDWEEDAGIVYAYDMTIQGKPFTYRTVNWLREKGANDTVKVVKEVFSVILNYLDSLYSKPDQIIEDQSVLEGIKTIMLLVGEAAKKLDKYTQLFQQSREKSVTELEEYKKLQEFYHHRIARKIDEGALVQWISALSHKNQRPGEGLKLIGKSSSQIKHLFMDLESVKKDSEYELFFLRKEDGTRFFSPRLIRNLKLVSDFGNYFGKSEEAHSVIDFSSWKDKYAHACAVSLLRSCRKSIEKFYQRALRHKENELAETLNKAVMALFLCVNSSHVVHKEVNAKTSRDYLCDFQLFLRRALYSRDYQHMLTYPPRKSSTLSHCLIDLVQSLCMGLYTQLSGLDSLTIELRDLIHQAEDNRSSEHMQECAKSCGIADRLGCDYAALNHLMKSYSGGPISKILETLENGEYKAFDPLIQENIPCSLYTLYIQNSKCKLMRWPSPTQQEFIHKGTVNQEFKAFLHACSHDSMVNKCLIFNLQDRTSWKEHCRSLAIEDLPSHQSYARYVEVVSLAKDTEFYHQQAPYDQDNHADTFMKLYQEQLLDEGCGFLFSDKIKESLAKGFIPRAMQAVHRIFFHSKNVLTRDQRLDFIEIFSLFLELKVIDLVRPDVVSFMCKDGVDQSQAAAVKLYVLLKLIHQERLSEHDRERLDAMLYGPALLYRERLMLPERFNRLLSVIKTLESIRGELGRAEFAKELHAAFDELYGMPLLDAKPIV